MRPRTRLPFAALAGAWLALAAASAGAAELMLKGGLGDTGNPALGFAAPTGMAASQDGRNLYVAGFGDDALQVFARDPASGVPMPVAALRDGVNGVDGLGGVLSVIVSGDDANVYAVGLVDQSVVAFGRNPATGGLGFLGQFRNGTGGVTGLDEPRSIAESNDGLFLYVACDSAIVVFSRNLAGGALGYVQTVALPAGSGAQGVAVSPDGINVYVGGYTFGELRIFARDVATGALALLDVMTNGQDGVSGLLGVDAVVVAPDGKSVYANGTLDSSVVHFARDRNTGLLQFVARATQGVDGVDGLLESAGLDIGGAFASRLYAGGAAGRVAVFERDPLNGALHFATTAALPGSNSTFTGSGGQLLATPEHLYVANGIDGRLDFFATAALDYVETEQDGVAGANTLAAAEAVAVTADGAQLYATSEGDNAVAVFQVDRATGALAASSAVVDGAGGVDGIATPRGVAASSDGKHVYVAGFDDSAIAAFARNPQSGALSFLEFEQQGKNGVTEMLGPRTLALSNDGRHLYTAAVVSDAVVWFTRDPATGGLSFGGYAKNGVGGVSGLDSAYAVAITPDGKHVYAAGLLDDSLVVFARNAATGALSFVSRVQDDVAGVDGLDGVTGVAVSPDGRHVYASGFLDNAVAVFARNQATGALGFVERRKDNEGDTLQLNGPYYVGVSPNSRWVVVTSSAENALNVFRRDRSSGRLFLAQVERSGVDGITGLAGARGIAFARDGSAVWVASSSDSSVVAFTPEPAAAAITAAAIASLAALARSRARR